MTATWRPSAWTNQSVPSAVLYSSVPVSAVFASMPSETVAAARRSTAAPSSNRRVVRKRPSYDVIASRDHSPNHGYPATAVGPVGVEITN